MLQEGKSYDILGYKSNLSYYEEYLKFLLVRLGFISGESFKVLHICPLVRRSYLLELEGQKISLSEDELSLLKFQ